MKTILIADDEKEARILVHITLADPRYRIIETSDGNTALELARKEKPDLLLLDWMMPHMSGPEVAEALRKDPLTANIPIIMLTAMGEEKDKQLARDLGVFAYVVKPFNPLALRERVRALLE